VTVRIDDVDRRIIALLQEDGRMSSLEISRRLGGPSDRAVRYRIDRLVKTKIIYIGAVVNAEAIGFPVVGDVLIDVVPWKLSDTAARLAALDTVSYVAACAETGSVSIQVNARSEWELKRFVSEVVGSLDGVTGCRTVVVPRVLKDVTDWPVPASV
jgi:DNA-binding Lrp family transcriptional regulator